MNPTTGDEDRLGLDGPRIAHAGPDPDVLVDLPATSGHRESAGTPRGVPRVVVAQMGARMHYAVPRICWQAGVLEHLYVDICATQGWPRLLRLVPTGLRTAPLRRLAGRIPRRHSDPAHHQLPGAGLPVRLASGGGQVAGRSDGGSSVGRASVFPACLRPRLDGDFGRVHFQRRGTRDAPGGSPPRGAHGCRADDRAWAGPVGTASRRVAEISHMG